MRHVFRRNLFSLACGEHKRTYWRHFPGVSIDCPDRSNIKSVVYKSIKHTNRKQSLALFRQRFLEILDFGIQPTFVGLLDTPQKLSFREPMMYNIARLLPITCNDRKASFDTVIFEIYRKHRKRTDIITGLVDIAISLRFFSTYYNRLYKRHFWNAKHSILMGATSISVDKLRETVRTLRESFTRGTRSGDNYLRFSEQLYNLLIRPIESELVSRKIKTLVFVPDSYLRDIPMAALYDGKQYLIERYSVAVTP